MIYITLYPIFDINAIFLIYFLLAFDYNVDELISEKGVHTMAKANDLTKGNVTGLILKFYFPMLLTNVLQQLYNIADVAIVGKGLGDNALAAVGNMSSLTFLIIGFSMGLANGFSVITAQSFGAKDTQLYFAAAARGIRPLGHNFPS